ncbi:MAG: GNAT family N-acetyltransferase [Flammeovirgaceae bacterium]|nr:GNAT family N-acetyltransferase [Flammeovirgaceae bacterium]
MWPDQELDYVKLPKDEEAIHFGLFMENKLTSVVSLFIEENGKNAQFRKFATLKEYQGKGLGSILLNFMLEKTKGKDISTIWCNARTNKTGFYEKFGFETTPTTFKKGGISYVIMKKRCQ